MIKYQRYTLDRIEDGFYVFLLSDDERQELVIAVAEISAELAEGDIVELRKTEGVYEVRVLQQETDDMKKKVTDLLEKLKNKQ